MIILQERDYKRKIAIFSQIETVPSFNIDIFIVNYMLKRKFNNTQAAFLLVLFRVKRPLQWICCIYLLQHHLKKILFTILNKKILKINKKLKENLQHIIIIMMALEVVYKHK